MAAQLEAQTESAELMSSTRDKLFTLKSIKTDKQLDEVDKGDSEVEDSEPEENTTPLLVEEDYNQRHSDKEEDEEEGGGNPADATSNENYEIKGDLEEYSVESSEESDDDELEEVEENNTGKSTI